MPIKLEQHLALLAKAERLSHGLSEMRQIIEREAKLAAASGDAAQGLENIELLARPDFLIQDLANIRAFLLFERQFYSEARVKAAKRQRQWRKLKKGEGDA